MQAAVVFDGLLPVGIASQTAGDAPLFYRTR